jgi:hypothetical protein
MRITCPALAALAGLAMSTAFTPTAIAQSSFIAPDGKNRFPGVTVFCPSGSGVAPCNFGGGGASGGAVSVNLGGVSVSSTNKFPVTDPVLEALIAGGAMKVGGAVSISGTPAVTVGNWPASQPVSGAVTVNLGSNPVAVGNRFPVADSVLDGLVTASTLPVSGSVAISGMPAVAISALPALPAGGNAIGSVSVSNLPATQAVSGTVGVSSLPALAAGSNAIGSVTVSNLPATQAVSGAVSVASLPPLPTGTNSVGTVNLAAGAVGSVTAGGTGGSVGMAVQGIAGGVAMPVTGNFYPATQPISAVSLPLPSGAATAAAQTAALAPVAPGAATATQSLVVGCQANTTLPSFTAGQQGAVPCDTSGRLYVVTVPSANNVPAFLQAVSAGGASTFSLVNAAASCMATNIKTSSGMVFSYAISNSNSTGIWARLFASATAPSCGSGTPAKRIYVPAGATVALSTDLGWVFATGIGFDVTSGSGLDTDATTVSSAGSVLVNIDYK